MKFPELRPGHEHTGFYGVVTEVFKERYRDWFKAGVTVYLVTSLGHLWWVSETYHIAFIGEGVNFTVNVDKESRELMLMLYPEIAHYLSTVEEK